MKMHVPVKIRHKAKLFIFPLVLSTFLFAANVSPTAGRKVIKTPVATKEEVAVRKDNSVALYESLQLDSLGLSQEAFLYGLQGFRQLLEEGRLQNDSILSIVDFSLPSTRKRLFVMDVRNGKLLFNTLVSHGRNSGKLNATSFSNKPNSNKSSLGFYITNDTYIGEHGLSLRLQGTEKGINDNAMERAIVVHGADYVNARLIHKQGYIGRSLGCPAIPESVHRQVITTIKNGSCLFLYSPNKSYIAHSRILQQKNEALAMDDQVM